MTRSTYKGFGVAPGLDAKLKGNGDRFNRFVNASFARVASTPDGYDVRGSVPAIKAGGMAAVAPVARLQEAPSNLLAGGPMAGSGSVLAFEGSGNASLVVGLAGNASVVTLTGNSMVLSLTIGLDGSGSFSLTGSAGLALIVPFEGVGSIGSLSGIADLRGLLSMAGEWTPFTALSPEGLARAVWDAQLASFDTAGSAGKALATASSGGVDLNLMAQAVWAYVSRTLTSGGGATPAQVADAVLAAAQSTPIHADTRRMNAAVITGDGSELDPWRGNGVSP